MIDENVEIAVIGSLTENGEYKNVVIDKENQIKINKKQIKVLDKIKKGDLVEYFCEDKYN